MRAGARLHGRFGPYYTAARTSGHTYTCYVTGVYMYGLYIEAVCGSWEPCQNLEAHVSINHGWLQQVTYSRI